MTASSARRGYTIIEVLIVIGIIAVVSVVAMASLSVARARARKAKALSDISVIVTAVKQLENDTGQWPGHQAVEEVTTVGQNELWDLNAPAAGLAATDGNFPDWRGPYIKNVPLDPWGNAYFWDSDYEVNGEWRVVVGSFGPNGAGQNVYDADNIYKIIR